jgi:hypothetical protein
LRLVVDASTLVGELLRERGQVLLASPHLNLYVPERTRDETLHEGECLLRVRVGTRLPEAVAERYLFAALRLEERCVAEIPEELYEGLSEVALPVAAGAGRLAGRGSGPLLRS